MHDLVLTFNYVFDKCEKYSVDVHQVLLACKYLLYLIQKIWIGFYHLLGLSLVPQLSSVYAVCKLFTSKLQKNILWLSHTF